jgi:acyl carrier protein
MGLDTVEFVMAIEDEFAICINDHDAAHIFTVGQLCDHIQLRLMTEHGLAVHNHEHILRRVAKILTAEFRINPAMIHRDARFIDDLGLD